MSSRSIHSMIESRSSSIERSMPLRADRAWRRKLSTETPGISCGYWKARNMPALPRTSAAPVGDVVALEAGCGPPVTSYSGLPSRVVARVDLPEPLGPIRACTSPAPMVRSTPSQDLAHRLAPRSATGCTCRFWISKRGSDMRRQCISTTAVVEMSRARFSGRFSGGPTSSEPGSPVARPRSVSLEVLLPRRGSGRGGAARAGALARAVGEQPERVLAGRGRRRRWPGSGRRPCVAGPARHRSQRPIRRL